MPTAPKSPKLVPEKTYGLIPSGHDIGSGRKWFFTGKKRFAGRTLYTGYTADAIGLGNQKDLNIFAKNKKELFEKLEGRIELE